MFKWSLYAQDAFQAGLLPVVNVNKKLKNGLKANLKTEARQILYQDQEIGWQHERLDISFLGSGKVGLNHSLAGGYLLRLKAGKLIHRSIQQFVINQRFPSFRLSHRFASDQTFEADKAARIRMRYRLSGQLPLSGQSADDREFYVKLNGEMLHDFKGDAYDLEMRLVGVLGYKITDNNKLEFGADNRFNGFFMDQLLARTWTSISWYIAM